LGMAYIQQSANRYIDNPIAKCVAYLSCRLW